jgi:hypothetical protein
VDLARDHARQGGGHLGHEFGDVRGGKMQRASRLRSLGPPIARRAGARYDIARLVIARLVIARFVHLVRPRSRAGLVGTRPAGVARGARLARV